MGPGGSGVRVAKVPPDRVTMVARPQTFPTFFLVSNIICIPSEAQSDTPPVKR